MKKEKTEIKDNDKEISSKPKKSSYSKKKKAKKIY
tara:strand:+ start:105 stop:209 length:105 start_codon:yes stop_codon:yes gene_type:complete